MPFLDVPPKLAERQFHAQVVELATWLRWHCWHDRATNMPRACRACHAPLDFARNDPGWPDLILIRRPRVLFVELKSDRGRLTDAQAQMLAELRACKQEVYVWRPRDWSKIEKILS
jgi:hypothetical protein